MEPIQANVIFKIVGVEPTFILFKCILEGSDYHIDDMPTLRFDLTNFADVDKMEEVVKRLGASALMTANIQKAQEDFLKNKVCEWDFESLLDKEISMSPEEAYSSNNLKNEGHYVYPDED
jgi:hypothetical protein